jgi:hypothetical protein
VHVEELHPPVGEKPVVWTLLTSEPIGSTAQIERIIDIYRYRWLIEDAQTQTIKSWCASRWSARYSGCFADRVAH